MEFLNNLEPLLQTFWYVAIPTSLIFIIQTILTFVGAEAGDSLDADLDGSIGIDEPMQLFSLRNLINFLLGFSWAGISLFGFIKNSTFLIIVAIAIGILFVYLFLVVVKQVQKLSEDNSFNISNAVDKSAEVYLTIPGNKMGKGKVLISIKGSFHELDAMTEHDTIASGAIVKVVRIENKNILIVETI